MKALVLLTTLCVLAGCSVERRVAAGMSKVFNRPLWDAPETGVPYWNLPHQSDPAIQKRRHRLWKKVHTERYSHTYRRLPWVWNCYTTRYEAWSWERLGREMRAGRVRHSPTGMGYDYVPDRAWQGWRVEAQERRRFNATKRIWQDPHIYKAMGGRQ